MNDLSATVTTPPDPDGKTPDLAVRLSSLSFSWKDLNTDTVFHEVSFAIRRGEQVALIGPNGAGKSTLLRCIGGLLHPLTGTLEINGKNIKAYSKRELARQVAFLPQASGPVPPLRVRDIVMMGRYPYFTLFEPASHEDRLAVQSALELTGTSCFADRRFDELSGGERQRVLLAAAIAQDAPILLLDEPFTFLDPAGQAEFSGILARLRQDRGVTVITVTHDLARAVSDGSRIIGLSGGTRVMDHPADVEISPALLEKVYRCPFNPISLTATTPEMRPLHAKGIETTSLPEILATSPKPWRRVGLYTLAVLALFLIVTLGAAIIGSPPISLEAILANPSGTDSTLFMNWRLPRCVTAFLAGSALSLAGLVFQAMFRNPLATPYTLGVSGGASFGAVVAMLFVSSGSVLGLAAVQVAAWAGALLSVAIVYGTFRMKRRASVNTMLLAGVGCSFLFSSLIMLLQYVCDPAQTIHTLYWMMGGVFVTGFGDALRLVPALAIGVVSAVMLTRELDVMMLGDEISSTRGVNVGKVRTILFFAVSLMTAAVVSLCGPIGFVGMMVPHICRLLFGPLHRRLLPASIAAGGVFLLACDVLARTVISPAEIPIGVITSLFGAPFLLLLIRRGEKE